MTKPAQERHICSFANSQDFEAWLADRAIDDPGAWVKFAKKASGIPSISKQEAIDIALCHGWIDGQLDRFDEAHFLVKFTPRRAKSKWSQNNRERAQQLIACGRMTPRGLDQIEKAKADGRWDAAYPSAGKAAMPEDLHAALQANPAARKAYDGLDGQNRYAILYRIGDAKRPATRAARIEKYVQMLARGETLHPKS
ncbi:MAG: YdeI/OmpD-associated family protein [Bordetella sp.]|uniref:YdeI/OmpD-associated family protein n=1 Tax=Bordetella sp. TaxID=28081 RepID=UPI003F7CA144